MKKEGKLNRSTGKDWTQFRARERMSSSVDRSQRRARVRIPLARKRTWITPYCNSFKLYNSESTQ